MGTSKRTSFAPSLELTRLCEVFLLSFSIIVVVIMNNIFLSQQMAS